MSVININQIVIHWQVGIYTGLPIILLCVIGPIGGLLADAAIEKKWCSLRNVFRSMETAGTVLPAIALVVVGYLSDSWQACISVLALGVGFTAFSFSGHPAVLPLIAPNYAGTAYGIMGTFSSCAGFLTPMVVNGFAAKNPSDPNGWIKVFVVNAALLFFAAIVFFFFVKYEPLSFNYVEERQEAKRRGKETKDDKRTVDAHMEAEEKHVEGAVSKSQDGDNKVEQSSAVENANSDEISEKKIIHFRVINKSGRNSKTK